MFRVRHETNDIATRVGDPGNVVERAIRIGFLGCFSQIVDITKHNLPILFELLEYRLIGYIATFTMFDGNTKNLARATGGGKSRVRRFHSDTRPLTNV